MREIRKGRTTRVYSMKHSQTTLPVKPRIKTTLQTSDQEYARDSDLADFGVFRVGSNLNYYKTNIASN